jgi:hypothetical protein
MPSLNKMMVLELARCEYVERRENVIALGNSGTGKTHIALPRGLLRQRIERALRRPRGALLWTTGTTPQPHAPSHQVD